MKMRKYLYFLIEAVLHVFVLISIIWLCVVQSNILTIVFALIGAFYFIQKIVVGIKLSIDIIEGFRETRTVFMGNFGKEHLDFFYKVTYTNVYFDDSVLTKNYCLFDGDCYDELHPDDIVLLKYYPRSRIVLQLCKCEDELGISQQAN